jgi:aminopeptidase YwaD
LEMAREIVAHPLPYSVLFIAFGGEEAGLIGSRYYVEHPVVPLEQTRFVLNLDLMGFGSKGGTVVNATVFTKEFARLDSLNRAGGYLPELKVRGKAANSDHYPFSERGVPAFFLYLMGGPGHYHDIDDRPETLDWQGLKGTYRLLMEFLRGF